MNDSSYVERYGAFQQKACQKQWVSNMELPAESWDTHMIEFSINLFPWEATKVYNVYTYLSGIMV